MIVVHCSCFFLLFWQHLVIVQCNAHGNTSEKIHNKKRNEPVVLRLLGLPKRGTYVVKEEIEKAPVHDHPCNLTETVVKISFPEMKSEVFVNLLGYKGSNMIHLKRCKGRCLDSDSPVSCTATMVREKKVKMTMRSFLTGGEPKEHLKELILDDHMECGCECKPELSSACAGMFNEMTCECECPAWEFGEKKVVCEMRRDYYWDSRTCQCASKTVAPRGVDLHNYNPGCGDDLGRVASAERHFNLIKVLNSSNTQAVDMLVWVLLGSSLTLVMVLAVATGHYRRQMKKGGDGEEIIRREINDEEVQVTSGQFGYGEYSDSTNSMEPFSSKEYQEDFITNVKYLKKTKSRSRENILIGLQGSQHIEIGGEIYYQPFDQLQDQVDNQYFS